MKLTIGENIRSFRKKNDLTQEELAERLGVTYQSVSRWENGTTYPDMEMLPAISELLSVTVDELIGMPKIEKEKQAKNLFEEFRRECMKDDYDAGRIVEMLRDIRRNYLDSEHAWNLWSENDRAYRDPKVLPEMRLVVSDYLKKYPKDVFAVRTMSTIEDEEHLEEFLKKYATELDCSKRELLFWRYYLRNEEEGYNRERKYKLLTVFETFFRPDLLFDMNAGDYEKYVAYGFLSSVLELVRRDAEDDRPDIWTIERLKIGIENAAGLLSSGKTEEALGKISDVVRLLEETMKLVEKAALPTSCRFVDGVEWCAYESWNNRNNDPNEPCERGMCIGYRVDSFFWCRVVVPRTYYNALNEKRFDELRGNEEFETLCERVKALIVTKEND